MVRGQGMVSRRPARMSAKLKPRCVPPGWTISRGSRMCASSFAIAIEAAKRRDEAMDHVLLCGPPGLGKTTLAGIIAQELSVPLDQTAGPVLQKKLDLTGIITNIKARQVFFVDEIHRLQPDIEELLYSVLEDFRVDLLVGTGAGGADTLDVTAALYRGGGRSQLSLLSAPLRGRFGLCSGSIYYDEATLAQIVERSAKLLDIEITDEAAHEIAKRGRGTPRVANRAAAESARLCASAGGAAASTSRWRKQHWTCWKS